MNNRGALLKHLALVLMTLVGVSGGAFAAGYAYSDLETAQAVGTTVPWLLLAIALSAFAYRSRRIAPWAFAGLTAFTVVRTPIESGLGLTDRDDPFSVVWVLVLAVALAVLGLHRTRLAGVLLGALGLGQLVATLVSSDRGSAGLGALLSTSSGAVVIPLLVVAALFLAADVLTAERSETRQSVGRSPRQQQRSS